MNLQTYQEVRPWARSIKERVATRNMPPWHLDKTIGIQEYANDRSLSDKQIKTDRAVGGRRRAVRRSKRSSRPENMA